MMLGPCTMIVSTPACDDLFRLMAAPMTPRSDRRALMSTPWPGDTRSNGPLAAPAAVSRVGSDPAGHRRGIGGDRVYERG